MALNLMMQSPTANGADIASRSAGMAAIDPGEKPSVDELRLYSQPILSLQSSQYEMAEVFVRLREEEETLLHPGDFLPAFEHLGMMPELDRWVTSNVLDHLRRGSRVSRFCINVSGQTLRGAAFPAYVTECLKTKAVSGAALVFEIDESDITGQPNEAASFASAIKAIGCSVSFDGFARHAISLPALKSLEPDFIKVDGSVIRNILRSEQALVKLNTVLRVAKVIGIDVIAESVEAQDTLARLTSLGVRHVQGYGIVEPHPIEKLGSAG